MSNEKVVDFLTRRNEILEKRCGRYRDLMKEADLDLVDILDSVNTGKLSMNDARYLVDLPEVESKDIEPSECITDVPHNIDAYTISVYNRFLSEWAIALDECVHRRALIPQELVSSWNAMIKQMRGDVRR